VFTTFDSFVECPVNSNIRDLDNCKFTRHGVTFKRSVKQVFGRCSISHRTADRMAMVE
jgi:hypothetical protein